MAGGHSHGEPGAARVLQDRVRRALLGAMVVLALLTAGAVALLWPDGDVAVAAPELGFDADLVDATVVSADEDPCPGAGGVPVSCQVVEFEVDEGPEAGTIAAFDHVVTPAGVRFAPGDQIVLGHVPEADPGFRYYFADFQRSTPLLVLAALFAAAVLLLGRWHGLRALVGLGLSLAVLAVFVLPALLEGSSPVAVALAGAGVIALVSLHLVHGINERTAVAVIGTLAALALIAVLSHLFTAAASLTGLASEDAALLQVASGAVDLEGLLLAGFVIGALGVLDDVTVTQVSAVWELRAANPDRRAADVFAAGLRIGRDHIASTVNTLVLAYAGASLPLLLLFSQAQRSLGDVATSEIVAIEVIRALVGSVGLVAAVPITTGLAVLVLHRARPETGTGPAVAAGPDEEPEAATRGPRSDPAPAAAPEAGEAERAPRWEDFAPEGEPGFEV